MSNPENNNIVALNIKDYPVTDVHPSKNT